LEPSSLKDADLLLGGDPEFEVVDTESGEIIPAYNVDVFDEGGDSPSSVLGTDGNSSIAEVRPGPCETPEEKAPWLGIQNTPSQYLRRP
jgi:hypothetical protein